MPQIIVRADTSGGGADLVTLTERIIADNFRSRDYTTQFIERICWATADAEALESQTCAPESGAKLRGGRRRPARPRPEGATRPIREQVPAPATISAHANADNPSLRRQPARGSLESPQEGGIPARPRVTAIEPLRTSTAWCGG
jgi:hypothetical protein